MKFEKLLPLLREGKVKRIRMVGDQVRSFSADPVTKRIIERRIIGNVVSEEEAICIPCCHYFDWEVVE